MLSQGEVLQFCVQLAETSSDRQVFVTDILSSALDQVGEGVNAGIIVNTEPNNLTRKRCRAGVCNVKTQLLSKLFEKKSPGPLIVSGTALLALGMQGERRLRIGATADFNRINSNVPDSQMPEIGRLPVFY